jgi:fibro-slime domain-containing protein
VDSGKGIYQYAESTICNSSGITGFFPLDGKGFGHDTTQDWNYRDYLNGTINNGGKNYLGNTGNNAPCAGDAKPSPHNYSFALHLKKKFVYRPNLTLSYRGDDDLWAFVNNKLVLDLGGMPHFDGRSITLDTMTTRLGLVIGRDAFLDVFYCERQASGSNIVISTNIFEYRQITSKQRHWKRDYGALQ